jgi:CubicO group peptidase (beta-lactamase class C family)
VQQGYLNVDDLARRYVAPDITGLHPDTRIRHLLTMSSGGSLVTKPSSRPPRKLDDDTPPGPPDEYVRTVGESTEPRAPRGYGVDIEPGSMFFYDGAAADHLAEIISAATGMTSYDYMLSQVFAPMGVSAQYQAEGVDSNGDIRIGGSMLITCRDMARLGQTYLDGGVWQGNRIVDASYVALATSPSRNNPDYGYLWWLNTTGEIASAPRSMYFAAGALGQYCFVVPEARLVVATMGFGRPPLEVEQAWDILGPALLG